MDTSIVLKIAKKVHHLETLLWHLFSCIPFDDNFCNNFFIYSSSGANRSSDPTTPSNTLISVTQSLSSGGFRVMVPLPHLLRQWEAEIPELDWQQVLLKLSLTRWYLLKHNLRTHQDQIVRRETRSWVPSGTFGFDVFRSLRDTNWQFFVSCIHQLVTLLQKYKFSNDQLSTEIYALGGSSSSRTLTWNREKKRLEKIAVQKGKLPFLKKNILVII